MKHVILYASSDFGREPDEVTHIQASLNEFLKENNLRDVDVCLVTSQADTTIRRIAIAIANNCDTMYHMSINARGAEALRDKLCTRGSDGALIFWNGKSKGTQKLIDKVEKLDIPFAVHMI